MRGKFDHVEYRGQFNGPELFQWLNIRMRQLSSALRGPVSFDAGSGATTKTLNLEVADLTLLQLTGNVAITLSTAPVAGTTAHLELVQDGIGGRVPTWVNNANTITAPAVGAGKKTMYLFVRNQTGWVGTVLASNY